MKVGPAVALVMLLGVAGVGAAACDAASTPCANGCPAGQVCDYEVGRCVELRPPEDPPDLGRYISAAVDSAGRLVVASYAARYGDLVLGQGQAGETFDWEYVDGLPSLTDPGLRRDPPTILSGPDVGLYASLDLDALDRPHVAYFDRTHGRLKYAVRTGQGWRIEQVPQPEPGDHVTGRGASLALDVAGLARIAYLDEAIGGLMLASELSAEHWQVEQISACTAEQDWPGALDGETGRSISLVLDKHGSEWIAFQDVCSGALKLATRKPDGWTTMEIAAGPDAGNWVSAALDSDGNVALAYHDRSQGSLHYAYNQAGSIQTLLVDPGKDISTGGAERRWPVGQDCALAFGHDGLPRIAYLDGQSLDLKWVAGLPGGGFGQPEVLDAEGAVGLFNAMVLGPQSLWVLSYRIGRDAAGASAGALVLHSIDSGAQRAGGLP